MKWTSLPSGIDSKLVDPAGTKCIVFKIQHLTRSLTGPTQLFVLSSAGQEELVMSYRAPKMGVVPDRESDPSPSHATSPRSGQDTIRRIRNERWTKILACTEYVSHPCRYICTSRNGGIVSDYIGASSSHQSPPNPSHPLC